MRIIFMVGVTEQIQFILMCKNTDRTAVVQETQ
jgi:hypothetical protein